MSAPEVKKGLLAQGFKEIKKERLLRRVLFDDYVAEVATESGRWDKDEVDAHLFLHSRRFAPVMEKLFGAPPFPFADYEARKALNDQTGMLAMVLAGIELHKKKPSLYSAAIHLPTERLGSLLDAMDSPESFYKTLYESELWRFMAIIEGLWVYLYLAAEQKLTAVETLGRITSSAAVKAQARQWHLEKAVDIEVIEAYFAVHRATAGPKRSKK